MFTILTVKSQEFITSIWEFLKTLPIWAQIIVIPLLTLTYFISKNIFKSKSLSDKILSLKRNNLKKLDKNLEYHNLFLNIKILREKVNKFNFNDKHKNIIFKTILICKLNSIENLLKKFLTSREFYKFETKCLTQSLMKLTIDTIHDYEYSIKKEIDKYYSHKNPKFIYNYVMNSEHGFNAYHKNNISHLILAIAKISTSDILDNNYERVSWYMDMVNIAVQVAILDFEKAFISFNGNFHKLVE